MGATIRAAGLAGVEQARHRLHRKEEALRYAMSLPIAPLGILQQNIKIARGFKPIAAAEMQTFRTRYAPLAADGHFELYKTSKKYDANEVRMQHGFPKKEEAET